LKNSGLSLLSGLLLILIFPRFNLIWLAPVALTPLLVASAQEKSWARRFLYGWAAGFLFWFAVCNWIQFVLEVHGGLGWALSWVSFFLFAILKGLHLALFAALAGLVLNRWWSVPAVAALWTGIERTHGPLGFAWLDLGNAGIGMPLAPRLAPWIGVYGLSFAFALAGCAAAAAILRRPRELAWLALLGIVLLFPALPPRSEPTEPVRVVQPNIDTEADWTIDSLHALERDMAALSRAPGVPLMVWPEAPAPFYPSSPDFREFIANLARESHAALLFGGVAHTARNEPLNSAFLVTSSGAIAGRYDKIKLVPFGEFVPPPFGWVNRITKEAGDFAAGTRIVVFPVDGHALGAFICYESAFPDLVRQFARQGAQVLVNLSNDGYFGHSAAREQHLEIVRMRAAENRRWILRATNDGLTAVVDPGGRVVEELPPYRETAATMHFRYVAGTTFYCRHGDWFAWSCLIGGLALCGVSGLSPRRPAAAG